MTVNTALQDAFKCYVRTRDYCSTAKDIIQMCLNVIKVAIELNNYGHVQNYVTKAESTPDVQVISFIHVFIIRKRPGTERAHNMLLLLAKA